MDLLTFVNSPLFGGLVTGLATLATGFFAIKVFKLQKADEKVNAAISILFEVRNAEEKVDIIQDKLNANSSADLPSVLPRNAWIKYSHLFAKDFDSDELKLMNSFYSSCGTIEALVNRQNNFIWVAADERARTAQRLLGDVHIEYQKDIVQGVPEIDAKTKFDAQSTAIKQFYTDEEYFYAPRKTLDGLKFEIERFSKVTTTTCGAKLKKMATV